MTTQRKLIENLAAVRGQIAEAAHRSGRTPDEITLVAVTKYVTADIVQQLVAAGCHDLGESRPQELWAKAEAIQKSAALQPTTNKPNAGTQPIRWHLVGHLQRNKVSRTLPLVSLIHSADSLRLLNAINQAAAGSNRRIPVLIEINISGDAAKHGFQPDEMEPALPNMTVFSSLEIRGLMGIASRAGDLAQARREFARLRELRDQLRRVAPPNLQFHELSMGMSGDFEAAIEQGATLVRIGAALFQGVIEQ
ncbi:MAG TPA: YggS family pyridoxal phosphate-dependent enzyme [Pirellulales bacterium]|nr:YggS family pyridoxal phosphate-dependent enzyme [Pirellulales bacterium]